MICDEQLTRCDDAGSLVWSLPGDGQGVVAGRRRSEHRIHRQPHLQRWVVSAIASWVQGHPPQDDRSYGCDGVWAGPHKKHLHDRACAAECLVLAMARSRFAGSHSTTVLWWPCSWPCGYVVAKYPEVMCRGLRIAKRIERSKVRLAATGNSRRSTTPVVE